MLATRKRLLQIMRTLPHPPKATKIKKTHPNIKNTEQTVLKFILQLVTKQQFDLNTNEITGVYDLVNSPAHFIQNNLSANKLN